MEHTTHLLLIRHGHHDPRGRFLQHACLGLTETGIAQAKALAARLARAAEITEPVVLASASRRSIDTAVILARTLGARLAERTCDLCEMHPGAAEGLTQEEMERQFGPSYQHVPGAEDFSTLIARLGPALERIADAYRGHTILAVTHSGVVSASLVALGGMPMLQASRLQPANTGITEWASPQEGAGERECWWRLQRYNDTAHL